MIQKITSLPLTVYLVVTGMFRELKKDERGLSDIVVAILLILVAVLAIVLIWGFLSGWIKEIWIHITGKVTEELK